MTFILTALDPRVKVAITCATCPMGDYYVTSVGWDETAKQWLAPVAARNFAPAISRTALLMLNGDQLGQVATIRIPQMADASGGFFVYNQAACVPLDLRVCIRWWGSRRPLVRCSVSQRQSNARKPSWGRGAASSWVSATAVQWS